jgi:hypothetical protein
MIPLLALLLAQAPHPAPPRQPRPAAVAPRPAPPPRPQRFEFEDDAVDGELQRPDGTAVQGHRRIRHSSLIEIPRTMLPALVKSFEEL